MQPNAEVELNEDVFVRILPPLLDAADRVIARRASQRRPPAQLFHFTDAIGLMGILKDRHLHASLAMAMNDLSESKHALQVCGQLLSDVRPNPDYKFVLAHALRAGEAETADSSMTNCYVVSFCSTADSAFHWLHYGNRGRGFAVALDSSRLEGELFKLYPVIYDRAEQESYILELIAAIDNALVPLREQAKPDELMHVEAVAQAACLGKLREIAAQMKNPVFQAEDEWRLIATDRTTATTRTFQLPVAFRAAESRIVPYIKCELGADTIREVVVGHSNPLGAADQALQVLWRETIGGTPKIRRSDVPVR